MFVAGCTSTDRGEFVHEGGAYAQTTQALRNVADALGRLGLGLADVLRTRICVTGISRWQEYGRAHRAAFSDTLPATTMIEVSAVAGPRMLAEAVAYRAGIGA